MDELVLKFYFSSIFLVPLSVENKRLCMQYIQIDRDGMSDELSSFIYSNLLKRSINVKDQDKCNI